MKKVLFLAILTLLFTNSIPVFTESQCPVDLDGTVDTLKGCPPARPLRYANTPERYLPFGNFTEAERYFFLDPLEYTGPGRKIPPPEDLKSVPIGFLGPIHPTVSVATGGASTEEPLGIMMLKGCQLAIEQANARGGWRNQLPYELMTHNDNGLWGASGSEIVDMVYKKNCRAIIGSIDGANSHIAIRVALKAETPMMNTGDTDPTFIETKIPWVFRCITDDRHMCYNLADWAFLVNDYKRPAALRMGSRYGRMSIAEFRDGARRLGFPFVQELQYVPGTEDFTLQLDILERVNPDLIITYGNSRESALILKQMRERGWTQPFLGSDRMVTQEFIDIVGPNHGIVVAGYPYDPTRDCPIREKFFADFRARFNVEPDHFAAHGYDGTNMVIDAIEKAGLNRALIRDALAEVSEYYGVTGPKVFDAIYNDISPACLAMLEDGKWNFYTREEFLPPELLSSAQ